MSYWRECTVFFGEFRRRFRETGSILPSSRFLADAMVAEMRKMPPPRRILEVGPGTGPVTAAILRCLDADDQLDIVEINGEFIRLLEERFATEPLFQAHRRQANLIHRGVEQLEGCDLYDAIISGLPLNNFPADLVRMIFRNLRRLIKPNGVLTYFEYTLIRQLKSPLVGRSERARLARVGRVVGTYIKRSQVRSAQVLCNMPPATVRHLVLKPKAPG